VRNRSPPRRGCDLDPVGASSRASTFATTSTRFHETGRRRVFDAVHAHISGAVKLGLNYRFGQVHPWSTEHRDRFIPQVTFLQLRVRVNPLVALGSRRAADRRDPQAAEDRSAVRADRHVERVWWAQSSLVDTDGFGHEVRLPRTRALRARGLQHFSGFARSRVSVCASSSTPGVPRSRAAGDLHEPRRVGHQGNRSAAEPPRTVDEELLVPPRTARSGLSGDPWRDLQRALQRAGELDFGPFVSRTAGSSTNWAILRSWQVPRPRAR